MITYLLADCVKRFSTALWWISLWLAGVLLWMVITPSMSDREVVSLSICGVMFLGWFFPHAMLALREVQLRPISRREIWLARCIIAAAACAVPALLLAFTLPFKGAGPADWATVAVTVLTLNLLYVAAFTGVAALLPPDFWAPGSLGPIKVTIAIAYFMAPIWPWALPFLWHVRPSEFTPATWAFVALACGLSIVAGRHAPAPGTMLPRTVVRSSGGGWAGQRIDTTARLRSLPFMLVTEARQALVFGGSAVIVIGVLNRLIKGHWIVPIESPMLSPFAGTTVDHGPSSGFLWMLFGPPGVEICRYGLRHLRVLPMSTTLLASTLVIMRWFHTAAAWLVLLTMVSLATGTWPAHLRLDLFSMALGLAAVGATGSLAVGKPGWRGQIPVMLCAVATAITIERCANPGSSSATLALWSMGPVLGGLSIVAHRILLNRRAALYRRPAPNWTAGVPQA